MVGLGQVGGLVKCSRCLSVCVCVCMCVCVYVCLCARTNRLYYLLGIHKSIAALTTILVAPFQQLHIHKTLLQSVLQRATTRQGHREV